MALISQEWASRLLQEGGRLTERDKQEADREKKNRDQTEEVEVGGGCKTTSEAVGETSHGGTRPWRVQRLSIVGTGCRD